MAIPTKHAISIRFVLVVDELQDLGEVVSAPIEVRLPTAQAPPDGSARHFDRLAAVGARLRLHALAVIESAGRAMD